MILISFFMIFATFTTTLGPSYGSLPITHACPRARKHHFQSARGRGDVGDRSGTRFQKSKFFMILVSFFMIFHNFSAFTTIVTCSYVSLPITHACPRARKHHFQTARGRGDVGDQQGKRFGESWKIMIFDSFFMIFMIRSLSARSKCRFNAWLSWHPCSGHAD